MDVAVDPKLLESSFGRYEWLPVNMFDMQDIAYRTEYIFIYAMRSDVWIKDLSRSIFIISDSYIYLFVCFCTEKRVGEHPAAMQHGNTAVTSHRPLRSLHILAISVPVNLFIYCSRYR